MSIYGTAYLLTVRRFLVDKRRGDLGVGTVWFQYSITKYSSKLAWLRCSRDAASASARLNSGVTRAVKTSVFLAMAVFLLPYSIVDAICTVIALARLDN
jgi:hypothetical protein